jgi:hypothetical protein
LADKIKINEEFEMKTLLTLLLVSICFTGYTHADDEKYIAAMKKNMIQMDSMKTVDDMIDLTNAFLRIANAEKDKWLPYYYASQLYILTSFTDTIKNNKDGYLDEALKLIAIADSLQPNESEIYVLKGFLCQARLQIDPMGRFMKYGPEMNDNFDKAIAFNQANPRPEYLKGITVFYTPEQFGGGKQKAKSLFESALKKFNEFVPQNEIMPKWGKEQVEYYLKQIP